MSRRKFSRALKRAICIEYMQSAYNNIIRFIAAAKIMRKMKTAALLYINYNYFPRFDVIKIL